MGEGVCVVYGRKDGVYAGCAHILDLVASQQDVEWHNLVSVSTDQSPSTGPNAARLLE